MTDRAGHSREEAVSLRSLKRLCVCWVGHQLVVKRPPLSSTELQSGMMLNNYYQMLCAWGESVYTATPQPRPRLLGCCM